MKILKRKKMINTFIALMGVVLLPLFSCMEVSAAAPTLTFASNGSDNAVLSTLCSTINTETGTTILKSSTGVDTVTVTIELSTYKTWETSKQTEAMQIMLDGINNSNLSTMTKNRLYTFIESQDSTTAALARQLSNDVSADFAGAYGKISWLMPGVSTGLGIISLIIFLTVTLMFVVDISYLAIPFVQNALTGSEKPKFISNEAWYAVKDYEESQGKKTLLFLYLQKKTLMLVALSICLLYLVSGQIFFLVGWLMDLFRGILA